MPKLAIPKEHRAEITKILDLDAPAIQRLQAAISDASPLEALTGELTSLIPLISELGIKNPNQFADTLRTLYKIKSARDGTVEEFVEDVCDAMDSSASEREKLRENLVVLLGVEELGLNAKALDLQTDDERTFCDGRILTDLRPVFGPDISEGPKAMVIVHILKLGYHQAAAGRHQEFCVSLDAEDLKTLRKIIDRAEEKTRSLKATVINFDYLAKS